MVNKQNLWFVTLFSIILVLSIYYVTISDNSLSKIISDSETKVSSEITSKDEDDQLVSLKVSEDETVLEEIEKFQGILLDETTTLEEKNDAYNSLQAINKNKSKETQIEELIKNEFQLKSFVKISDNQINITIMSKEHNKELANKIIRKVQSLHDVNVYITVKFQNN